MENKDIYISFRKSLDSYRDVLLAEIQLIADDTEKEQFAEAVTSKIKELLKENARERAPMWWEQNVAQAKKFMDHAEALLSANPPGDCPPGFELVDGICVRI